MNSRIARVHSEPFHRPDFDLGGRPGDCLNLSGGDETLTVQIPMRLRKRGGRKLMVVPQGTTAWAPQRARVDNAMVKAIARAHRWRGMLESGAHSSIAELAAAEKINQSYICRVLRLSLLAPKIVEAILDGRQPSEMLLANLMQPFPVGWQEQIGLVWLNALEEVTV